VSGIERIAMDGTRAVIRMSDTSTYSGTFLSPRQDIVLLSTGTRHSIRWSDLLSVEQDGTLPPAPVTTPLVVRDPARHSETPAVTPGAVEPVPGIAQPKREDQGDVSVTSVPDTAAEVELRTAFGRFKVPPDALWSVRGCARESLWHVTTRFGEVFTATRVSRDFLQDLSAMETNTARKSVSEWQLSTEPVCPPVEGGLAWRLKSGSVFYAAIADESVRLVPSGGRGDSIEIPSNSIVSFISEEPGIWTLGTAAGPRRGTPAAGTVRVRLACNGNAAAVRYSDIDRDQRCRIEDLPPPLSFVPFATPVQESSVLIPGGRFVMGRESGPGPDDEVPARPVAVSPFLMDACEVTRGQFAEFARQTGFRTDAERQSSRATWQLPGFRQSQDEPVVNVTWNDAARYCNWRSRCAGLAPCYDDGERNGELVCDRLRNGYRLPTEAEWEYACRNGGKTIPYPWGSASDPTNAARNANFAQEKDLVQDGWLWTNPVKSFQPNRIGLYGMAGNTWEWCEDWYSERAYSALFALAVDDPCVTRADMAGLVSRAMRGGSFANSLDMLRCTGRGHGAPGAWANRVGFRCVRNAPR
jgi:sulfatase modifying factor 1